MRPYPSAHERHTSDKVILESDMRRVEKALIQCTLEISRLSDKIDSQPSDVVLDSRKISLAYKAHLLIATTIDRESGYYRGGKYTYTHMNLESGTDVKCRPSFG